MITAVDTNVLIDVLAGDPQFGPASAAEMRRCMRQGSLIACEVVWTEAAVSFDEAQDFRDAIRILGVTFSPMSEEAALAASSRWRLYRRSGGARNRVVADFMIGAHALVCEIGRAHV